MGPRSPAINEHFPLCRFLVGCSSTLPTAPKFVSFQTSGAPNMNPISQDPSDHIILYYIILYYIILYYIILYYIILYYSMLYCRTPTQSFRGSHLPAADLELRTRGISGMRDSLDPHREALKTHTPSPAPPNYPLRYPKYQLMETIRPGIEVHWRGLGRTKGLMELVATLGSPFF